MTVFDSTRWPALSPWLDRILDADADERAALLEQARREAPDIADQLASLMAHETRIERERFLEQPIRMGDATMVGRVVGNYTLDAAIGEGGMGNVWLAHRSDGRFEGRAAVKFLNASMIGRGGIARFEREGRILARLAHPHIARLIDAGVDEQRQPYLVLEYVEGVPIDRWCDDHALDVPARLALFLDVLAAVGDAHRNLILHRDLKPSNILVAHDGQVKLLDFGIAKLLDHTDATGGATALTQVAGRAFTPEYAAPEQVQGRAVTTATDVYALGVLLYHLLCGSHPTSAITAAPVDRLRSVVETEATRVSDAASRIDAAIAARRASTPMRLARALRGDLDNIVAKALKKEPEERYAGAAEFADDVRRYLQHEPVKAIADTIGYRFGKFVRRNRFGVAALAAIVVTLVAGIAATVWQAREAAFERDRALTQLARVQAMSDFVGEMVDGTWSNDERITRLEFLERSEKLARRSQRNPEERATLFATLSNFYGTLGDNLHARALDEEALRLTASSNDMSRRGQLECSRALSVWQIDHDPATRETLARWAARADIEPNVSAACESNLAKIGWMSNAADDALTHAQNALRLVQRSPRADPMLEASIHGDLGYTYSITGRSLDADREFGKAIAAYRDIDRMDSPHAVTLLNNWGVSAVLAGDVKRALALYDEAIERSLSGATGKIHPSDASNRASALLALGRYDDAIEQADRAHTIAKEAGSKGFECATLLTKTGAYIERGDLDLAARTLAEATAVAESLPPDTPIRLIVSLRRAKLDLARNEPRRALDSIQPVLAVYEKRKMRIAPLALALLIRADAEHRLANDADAMRDANDALAITQKIQGDRPLSLLTGQSWLALARIDRDRGAVDEARTAARNALPHLVDMMGPAHRDVLLAREIAGTASP